jgi:limonene-1,2-epoxide hydrolase
MTSPTTHAERMVAFFEKWDSDFDTMVQSFRDIFADDCSWWNTDQRPLVHGIDEAIEQVLKPSRDTALAMECIRVEMVNIAQDGNKVYHERIDHILHKDGSVIIAIPIAGITEFNDDGRIVNWRDYCDPSGMMAIIAGQEAGVR